MYAEVLRVHTKTVGFRMYADRVLFYILPSFPNPFLPGRRDLQGTHRRVFWEERVGKRPGVYDGGLPGVVWVGGTISHGVQGGVSARRVGEVCRWDLWVRCGQGMSARRVGKTCRSVGRVGEAHRQGETSDFLSHRSISALSG